MAGITHIPDPPHIVEAKAIASKELKRHIEIVQIVSKAGNDLSFMVYHMGRQINDISTQSHSITGITVDPVDTLGQRIAEAIITYCQKSRAIPGGAE
jgi:hypothetical protein